MPHLVPGNLIYQGATLLFGNYQIKTSMTRHFIRIVFLCFILSSCSKENDAGMSETEQTNVAQAVLNSYESGFEAGGVIAYILKANGDVIEATIGESEPGIALKTNMRFAIGSISKTFTAVLTLKLIENGDLTLNATIAELLPSLVSAKIPGTITVEELLYHSSGLDHPLPGADGLFNYVINNPEDEITLDEFIGFMDLPQSDPGTQYAYSDANYKVLGLIIEHITGLDYYDYLNQELLAPLGLTDIFRGSPNLPDQNIAYSWIGNESAKDLNRTAVESMGRYTGDIWASAADLTKWFQAIFEGNILNDASMEIMTSFYPGDRGVSYGGGMLRDKIDGKIIYYYSGFTISYSTYCGYVRSTGDYVVLMNNQWNSEETLNMVADLVAAL
jgi:D-alanyl-D-alanine carboxypeptidase